MIVEGTSERTGQLMVLCNPQTDLAAVKQSYVILRFAGRTLEGNIGLYVQRKVNALP